LIAVLLVEVTVDDLELITVRLPASDETTEDEVEGTMLRKLKVTIELMTVSVPDGDEVTVDEI
jgi:hypothetical protein